MKKVITASALEAYLKEGKSIDSLPANSILTPSAKDMLKNKKKPATAMSANISDDDIFGEPMVPDYEFKWTPGQDPKTKEEIREFFLSPEIHDIKVRMCDMGDRMWKREYTDGNGGNLTVRVGDNLVLCTPTLICKGYMKPEDIALIDLDGNQLAGKRKRTSEAMTHLAIMKRQPKAKACCHAHPPHATAYAVAKVQPPTCLIPEAEVFLGQIGIAEYRTPGSPENAQVVGDAAVENMSVLMLNHGVITWGKDIEDAYWKMENTESYCKTVWVASQLGKELTPISGGQAKELIALRKSLGMEDKRANLKECELCDNSEFRPGFVSHMQPSCALPKQEETASFNNEAEDLVKAITTEIMRQMGK